MYLGIDTSAYTTSFAIVKDMTKDAVVLDKRKLLSVELGKRGLRQSEAVFNHINNLNDIANDLRKYPLKAIAVTNKPRPKADSYMPVFKVSQAVGTMIAKLLNIPVYQFSHQEGHIMAGLWSTDNLTYKKSLVIHISGGTSDVMAIEGCIPNIEITELGCSHDLHAGQFVDRVGVMLGAEFPAGKTMDKWSVNCNNVVDRLPSSVNGYNMSFSGPESAAQRLVSRGRSKYEISKMVFINIARTLEKVIRYAYEQHRYSKTIIVGGVAANSFLREELVARLPYDIYFCDKRYSSDNAVGTALLALKMYENRRM